MGVRSGVYACGMKDYGISLLEVKEYGMCYA